MPDPALLDDVITGAAPGYGLRRHILSPLEVLAQSVSVIAPSSTPPITIPLVFALAGEGTWLAYAIAMGTMVLIAYCIAEFARDSASPGSLYVYTKSSLPPVFAAVAAWALFFAYVVTGAATAAAFVFLLNNFLGAWGMHLPITLAAGLCMGGVAWIAARDIRLSTEAMLWIEVVSVLLIAVVVGILLAKHGFHLDMPQWKLEGVTPGKESLAVMLALFSFVGFESATSLGEEAREPLKTIPQAVMRSALLAGVFFMVCAYGEVLGFRGVSPGLGEHDAPMRLLAARAGVGWAGWVIDLGVLISMFACSLGCVIASARVLLLMAHDGLAHRRFKTTNTKQETPAAAGVFASVLAFVPIAILAQRGVRAEDLYPWFGTLSVYGFMTAYGLVAVALPFHLKKVGRMSASSGALAIGAALASLAAMGGTMYPLPPAPYLYMPWIYLAFMASGMAWWFAIARRQA